MLSPDKGLGKTGFPVSECWKSEEKLGLEGSSGPSPLGLVWRRQPGVGGFRGVSLLPCPPPPFPTLTQEKGTSRPRIGHPNLHPPLGGSDIAAPFPGLQPACHGAFPPHFADEKIKAQGAICLSPHRELIAGLGLTVSSWLPVWDLCGLGWGWEVVSSPVEEGRGVFWFYRGS